MTYIAHRARSAAATPVAVRILVLAMVILLGVLLFGSLVTGDAWEAYRDPIGNHTGITPYGYPGDTARASRGRQECTYYGGRLDCQEGGRP